MAIRDLLYSAVTKSLHNKADTLMEEHLGFGLEDTKEKKPDELFQNVKSRLADGFINSLHKGASTADSESGQAFLENHQDLLRHVIQESSYGIFHPAKVAKPGQTWKDIVSSEANDVSNAFKAGTKDQRVREGSDWLEEVAHKLGCLLDETQKANVKSDANAEKQSQNAEKTLEAQEKTQAAVSKSSERTEQATKIAAVGSQEAVMKVDDDLRALGHNAAGDSEQQAQIVNLLKDIKNLQAKVLHLQQQQVGVESSDGRKDQNQTQQTQSKKKDKSQDNSTTDKARDLEKKAAQEAEKKIEGKAEAKAAQETAEQLGKKTLGKEVAEGAGKGLGLVKKAAPFALGGLAAIGAAMMLAEHVRRKQGENFAKELTPSTSKDKIPNDLYQQMQVANGMKPGDVSEQMQGTPHHSIYEPTKSFKEREAELGSKKSEGPVPEARSIYEPAKSFKEREAEQASKIGHEGKAETPVAAAVLSHHEAPKAEVKQEHHWYDFLLPESSNQESKPAAKGESAEAAPKVELPHGSETESASTQARNLEGKAEHKQEVSESKESGKKEDSSWWQKLLGVMGLGALLGKSHESKSESEVQQEQEWERQAAESDKKGGYVSAEKSKQHAALPWLQTLIHGRAGEAIHDNDGQPHHWYEKLEPRYYDTHPGGIAAPEAKGKGAEGVPGVEAQEGNGGHDITAMTMKQEGHVGTVHRDNNGVFAYGAFQFNQKGQLKQFLKSDYAKKYPELSKYKPGSAQFNQAWKELSKKDPKGFLQAQKDFEVNVVFKPDSEKAKALGFKTDNPGVASALFSANVNHSPKGYRSIITQASHIPGFKNLSPEDQIKAFYRARNSYIERAHIDGGEKVKAQLRGRYASEQKQALAMAGDKAAKTELADKANAGESVVKVEHNFVDPATNPHVNKDVVNHYEDKGKQLPVVLRNNNMGAVSLMNSKSGVTKMPGFVGMTPRPVNEGGYYAKFATPEHGIYAASKTLDRYAKQGINTPDEIVRKWSTDRKAWAKYAADLAKAAGVKPNEKLNLKDPETRAKVLEAMSAHESGTGKPLYDHDTYLRGVKGEFGGQLYQASNSANAKGQSDASATAANLRPVSNTDPSQQVQNAQSASGATPEASANEATANPSNLGGTSDASNLIHPTALSIPMTGAGTNDNINSLVAALNQQRADSAGEGTPVNAYDGMNMNSVHDLALQALNSNSMPNIRPLEETSQSMGMEFNPLMANSFTKGLSQVFSGMQNQSYIGSGARSYMENFMPQSTVSMGENSTSALSSMLLNRAVGTESHKSGFDAGAVANSLWMNPNQQSQGLDNDSQDPNKVKLGDNFGGQPSLDINSGLEGAGSGGGIQAVDFASGVGTSAGVPSVTPSDNSSNTENGPDQNQISYNSNDNSSSVSTINNSVMQDNDQTNETNKAPVDISSVGLLLWNASVL